MNKNKLKSSISELDKHLETERERFVDKLRQTMDEYYYNEMMIFKIFCKKNENTRGE